MEVIDLPIAVKQILDKLNSSGCESYIVGGCVRDSLMGIEPHDWDVCTSALPEQILETFADFKTIPTGLKHGTVTVVIDSVPYEITTFRVDGAYSDSRRPDTVTFVSDLKSDLMRRDFTINAMAYNPDVGIVDLFGGINDIENRTIRCVGNPDERFSEDALRMLRAIRFSIRFHMKISDDVRKSIIKNQRLLKNISHERISSEIIKTLDGTQLSPEDETSLEIFAECLGEVDYDIYFSGDDLIGTTPTLELRLAMMILSPSIFRTEDCLKRMRFSNEVIAKCKEIHDFGMKLHCDFIKCGNCADFYTKYYYRSLLKEMKYFDIDSIVEYAKWECLYPSRMKNLDVAKENLTACIERNDVYRLSDLNIDGNDLIKLTYHGEQIGDVLDYLLDRVMADEISNDRESLLDAARNYYLL